MQPAMGQRPDLNSSRLYHLVFVRMRLARVSPGSVLGLGGDGGAASSGMPLHLLSRGSAAEDPKSKELGTIGTNPDGLSKEPKWNLPTQTRKGVQGKHQRGFSLRKLWGLERLGSGSLARERCNCWNSEEMQSDLGRKREGRYPRDSPDASPRDVAWVNPMGVTPTHSPDIRIISFGGSQDQNQFPPFFYPPEQSQTPKGRAGGGGQSVEDRNAPILGSPTDSGRPDLSENPVESPDANPQGSAREKPGSYTMELVCLFLAENPGLVTSSDGHRSTA